MQSDDEVGVITTPQIAHGRVVVHTPQESAKGIHVVGGDKRNVKEVQRFSRRWQHPAPYRVDDRSEPAQGTVVPKNDDTIRFQVNADHTDADIDSVLASLRQLTAAN